MTITNKKIINLLYPEGDDFGRTKSLINRFSDFLESNFISENFSRIEDCEYINYTIPNEFYKFAIDNFDETKLEYISFFTQEYQNIKFIQVKGQDFKNTLLIDRIIKNIQNTNKNSFTVHSESSYACSECDYNTAIEIVTTEFYKIPKFECFQIEDNLWGIKEILPSYFSKSRYEYDMKSYGMQWM
jgi:hypothetical protein